MPSSNKTSCGLNQWISSDQPMMADFNRDNALLDAALAVSKNAATASRELHKDKILLGDGERKIYPTYYSIADTAGEFYRLTLSDSSVKFYVDSKFCGDLATKTCTFSMEARLVSGNPTGYLSAYIQTSAGYRGWDGGESKITPTPSWQTCTISDMQGLTDGSNLISLSADRADLTQGTEFVIDIRNPRLLDADGNNMFPSRMIGLGEFHSAVEETDEDCLIPTLQKVRKIFGDYTIDATSPPYTRFTIAQAGGINVPIIQEGLGYDSFTFSLEVRCISSNSESISQIGPTGDHSYWDNGEYLTLPTDGSWATATLSDIGGIFNLGLFFYASGTYDIRNIALTDPSGKDILDHAAFQAQGEYYPGVPDSPDNYLIPTSQKVREIFEKNMVTATEELFEDKILLGGGGKSAKTGDYTVDAFKITSSCLRFSVYNGTSVTFPPDLDALNAKKPYTLTLEARCISSSGYGTPKIGPNNWEDRWDNGDLLTLVEGGEWKSATLSGIQQPVLNLIFYVEGIYDIRNIKITDADGKDISSHYNSPIESQFHMDIDTPDNHLLPTLRRVRETVLNLCGEKLHGLESLRVGSSCKTTGKNNVALGNKCSIDGNNAFAQGDTCTAIGNHSHAEGGWCRANGAGSHAEGNNNQTDAPASHVEGDSNQISVSCDACHVEGIGNNAVDAKYAHVEGRDNQASAISTHAEGYHTTASAEAAHAQGVGTTASGYAAHAQGNYTTASGSYSHAGGDHAQALGTASFAHGSYVKSTANNVAIGRYNKAPTDHTWSNGPAGDAFVIGNGSGDSSRSNAFRVSAAGQVYGANFNTSGADYAEFFEWADGNPDGQDRTGLFVTLDGDKLRLAQDSSEYVLGVISCSPSVIGNAQSEQWVGQYVRDVFGRIQYEETEVEEEAEEVEIPALTGSLYHPAEYTTERRTRVVGQDETGKDIIEEYQEPVLLKEAWTEENAVLREGRTERVVTRPAGRMVLPKYNPDYDPSREYLPRELRPEWSPVGMLGRLVVTDDGSCLPNGCCVPKNGVATTAESGYRVIRRLDESHVEIILK